MKIVTENICPPIPIRKFDWQATFDDYDEGDPVGHGQTEQEAIEDLVEQVFEPLPAPPSGEKTK